MNVRLAYWLIFWLISFPGLSFGFDHHYQEWGQFLKKYISYSGPGSRFDYTLLRQHPAELDLILFNFSELPKTQYKQFTDKQKIAFLINGYNAFSLKLASLRYPIIQLKEATPLVDSPYSKKFIPLFGKKYSLDNLERRWLMKGFEDLRVLFAIKCLCRSCPNLQPFPYLAEKLDMQLEQSIRLFLSDPEKNQIRRHHLYLSALFDRQQEYFYLAYHKLSPFFQTRWPEAASLIEEGRYSFLPTNNDLNDLLMP